MKILSWRYFRGLNNRGKIDSKSKHFYYSFFHFKRELNSVLTHDIIKTEANEIYRSLIQRNGDVYIPFTGGRGWYRGFRDRFGLKYLKEKGETKPSDFETDQTVVEEIYVEGG